MSQPSSQPAGILLMDKPISWSSHRVVNFVRRATGVKRVGHTGTLDPFASGLLIILVGREFTKLQDSFLKQDKTYECQFELGYETTTLDSTGDITKSCNQARLRSIDQAMVQTALNALTGTQQQRPPAFAAIKQSGVTLYQQARELLKQSNGVEELEIWQATLPAREVTIHSIQLSSFQAGDINHPAPTINIMISCSSGTYIRSLIRDVGEKLGTYATATALRRTSIGHHKLENANTTETPSSEWRWLEHNSLNL
jgi:tRNA pseudouridine55 synthase